MDETFRLKRSYRNEALCALPIFMAVDVAALYMVRTINSPHPVAMACLLLGVPSFMAGLSAWLLVAYWRSGLTIRGESVTDRGAIREKSIDLRDVTEARWRIGSQGGSVLLRTESGRFAITFGYYEAEAGERIILYLRSFLPLEIQVDWNLYVYKVDPFRPRTPRTKPGPDEVLVKRDRYDRYLWPSLAMASLYGIVVWWFTGELRGFGILLMPLAVWALFRFTTPVEGVVEKKLSALLNPDLVRFLWFAIVWLLVALGGMAVNEYFRPRMDHVDGILIVGIVAWFAVLFYEAYLLDRRMARRDREAADLAAKARGESSVDPWPSE